MNVGYYYHVEAVIDDDGDAWVPAHLGVFLRELAEQAGAMTLFVHTREGSGVEDYRLPREFVRPVDLGKKRWFPSRAFWPWRTLRRVRPRDQGIDAMLIQGPSPLLPGLVKRCSRVPVALLVWGDYRAWQPRPTFSWWRNAAIWALIRIYSAQQRHASRGNLAFVQSPLLAPTVSRANVVSVPFSSIAARDLPELDLDRVDWPPGRGRTEPLRLLYSGRIVREKGLFEAVEALALLKEEGISAVLDVLGWEDESDPTITPLRHHAEQCGVADRLRFLGYRRAGAELLSVYREADVFVIPTYWDSVPKSMQEAMATGLPTIASDVGGIGYYLRDREHALLIPPRSPDRVVDAVRELLGDAELRRSIAERGATWARRYTNETSCSVIIEHLRDLVGDATEVARNSGSDCGDRQ